MGQNRRHTVLVVDDEADVVSSVKDLLRLDYKVLGATKVSDALSLLEKEPVDVVMTDQRMPETNGVELLKQVRVKYPDAVRLLFTGYADIRAVVDAINEGNVYRYITKPWDPDELMAVLREACDRHDLVTQRNSLLEELKEKNAQLERANAELRHSDELKNAFIRVASHELRTPLTILLGISDLTVRQARGEEPVAGLAKRIHQAAGRLQHLVDQIVTMLSMQQFERRPEKAPSNLSKLVGRAVDDVRPFAELRKQALVCDIPEDLGTIDVDEAKIRDAANHILLNAIKFTPDQGTITVGARRENGDARIWVSDTGIGLDAASLSRVFDKFFTEFDVSHHSSGHFEYGKKGLGLGLSVVKAFVEMHGGRVEVSSEVGKGTTFTIHLPAKG